MRGLEMAEIGRKALGGEEGRAGERERRRESGFHNGIGDEAMHWDLEGDSARWS